MWFHDAHPDGALKMQRHTHALMWLCPPSSDTRLVETALLLPCCIFCQKAAGAAFPSQYSNGHSNPNEVWHSSLIWILRCSLASTKHPVTFGTDGGGRFLFVLSGAVSQVLKQIVHHVVNDYLHETGNYGHCNATVSETYQMEALGYGVWFAAMLLTRNCACSSVLLRQQL